MSTAKQAGKAAGIVAAVALPHAPQLLSVPETEDRAQVERVKQAMVEIGQAFKEKAFDCVIVLSNDHGDHFVTHSVPPFCVHAALSADGMHKHRGHWALDSDLAYDLVPEMSTQGFDLAFTLSAKIPTAFTIPYAFMGFDRDTPMLALFVNSYIPPQPDGQRCFAFGQALERALCKLGRRALLIASGGLSHYPGTSHYSNPDVETDRGLFERMCGGDLQFLAGIGASEMDRTGNVELRAVQILAGAIGDRKPFYQLFEPSWHHTYALLAWDAEAPQEAYQPIYPRLPAAHAQLVEAVFQIRTNPEAARAYLASPESFCDRFELSDGERAALLVLDEERLRDGFGIHALLTAGAKRHTELLSRSKT
ncbi:hypothetical protein [Paracandidimonas soli]|uniref:2,3-dihydroxyphenylpropionate 1,2-dioxygenase n=1 Tax=Paracandidimonas soli TaxID=1917182 RepID=A0A4R3UY48_9BURK|nr:hypothetical protein [Paracandidimonas soli]TCU96050.1 2,3-dihydroxyphenylpropionate 1,2-dioxygenase [Paracandidimonas soli]